MKNTSLPRVKRIKETYIIKLIENIKDKQWLLKIIDITSDQVYELYINGFDKSINTYNSLNTMESVNKLIINDKTIIDRNILKTERYLNLNNKVTH